MQYSHMPDTTEISSLCKATKALKAGRALWAGLVECDVRGEQHTTYAEMNAVGFFSPGSLHRRSFCRISVGSALAHMEFQQELMFYTCGNTQPRCPDTLTWI